MDTIVSQEKNFLKEVLTFSATNVKDFGIEIVDVRIKTDLPIENRNAVFERMKSDGRALQRLSGQKARKKHRRSVLKQIRRH